MARWAVFDVDGTLLPHTSSEQLFFKELIAQQIIPPTNVLLFAGITVWYLVQRNSDNIKANKWYLRKFPVKATHRFARHFFNTQLWTRFSSRGLAEVNQRYKAGYQIFILSGAPNFLIEPLRHKIPVAWLLASIPEERHGYYTGRLAAPHPYAHQKRDYLLELAPSLEMDFSRSVVFANHHTDALHMELFGEVVAVNPTPQLERAAQRNRWQVVRW